jgi:hypothetical protein
MELIRKYNKSIEALYEHVGLEPTLLGIFPIQDRTKHKWRLEDNSDFVHYKEGGKWWDLSISNEHWCDNFIYEGKELTLIFTDDKTEGGFSSIFSNDKRLK